MQNLVDLKALSKLKDLPLVADTLAQGFLQGMHLSIQRGVGVEFSQYRSYEPGDSLAKIDWKLFARSDKYFVREAERESDFNIWFVIDVSQSMQQQSSNNNSLSKFHYSKMLAATLACLAKNQGDNIGVLALNSKQLEFLPAMAGDKHYRKCLLLLSQLTAGGYMPPVEYLRAQLAPVQQHGLVFLISDFYPTQAETSNEQQNNNELLELALSLTNSQTEVVAIQLESDDEVNFPFKGAKRFQDLESGQEVLLTGKQARTSYLKNRAAFNQKLAKQLTAQQIQHWQVNIDKPMDESLFNFIQLRNKR